MMKPKVERHPQKVAPAPRREAPPPPPPPPAPEPVRNALIDYYKVEAPAPAPVKKDLAYYLSLAKKVYDRISNDEFPNPDIEKQFKKEYKRESGWLFDMWMLVAGEQSLNPTFSRDELIKRITADWEKEQEEDRQRKARNVFAIDFKTETLQQRISRELGYYKDIFDDESLPDGNIPLGDVKISGKDFFDFYLADVVRPPKVEAPPPPPKAKAPPPPPKVEAPPRKPINLSDIRTDEELQEMAAEKAEREVRLASPSVMKPTLSKKERQMLFDRVYEEELARLKAIQDKLFE